MQFYSDYSSEEDFPDEDDLWNPNEILEEIEKTEDAQERDALKRRLLENFLDQQRPMLTSKMKEFLLDDGVAESLMNFVSRLESNPNNNTKSKKITRELNPNGSEQSVRRSFNVMEIFLNPMNDLDILLEEKLVQILKQLFQIFDQNALGNFHHFNKILGQLLIRAPVETTSVLISEQLFWRMLDYLHEPAIADAVVDVFCCTFPKQNDTIQFYKSLVDEKVFERVGDKIYGNGQPFAAYAGEFFIKLLEKLASHEMSGILFISLCRNSHFIDGLFKPILTDNLEQYPLPQQQACANVLRELLLKSGEKLFEQADFTRPLPNMLSSVHDKLHAYAKSYVTPLCNLLIAVDNRSKDSPVPFQSYVVRRPFSQLRFTLVEILSDMICQIPEVLDHVPQQTWRVLSSWMFEYVNNNMYHFQFFKILQTVIRTNHLESQKTLLNKYKFLSKMIEHYRSGDPSAIRGHILIICNMMRLEADLQPVSGPLRRYLASHDAWKSFLPVLRADTLLQLKRYSDMESFDDEDDEEDEEEEGIDLGSAYARSLGYHDLPPVEEITKKKKKKKRSKSKSNVNSPATTPKKDSNNNNATANGPTSPSVNNKQPQPPSPSQQQPQQPTKVSKQDDDVVVVPKEDMTFWSALKQDLDKEEEKKKVEHGEGGDKALESDSWWKDLKADLEKEVESPEPVVKKPANPDGSWWDDLKADLDETQTTVPNNSN